MSDANRMRLRDALAFYRIHGHFGPYAIRGGESNPPPPTPPTVSPREATPPVEGEPDDKAELKTALSKERDARKAAEKSATDLERRLKAIEDANKSELQKALDKAADLETKYGAVLTEVQAERAERLVLTAATKANAVRPDAVFRLVRDGLEYEDGKPTNVDAAVKQARAEYPELFRAAAGSGDGGKTGETAKDSNALLNAFIRGGR